MKLVHGIASVLVWVGGLNWGIVGVTSLFGKSWNLVTWLFGSWSVTTENVVYVLVGVSAVYVALTHRKTCKECGAKPIGGQTAAQ